MAPIMHCAHVGDSLDRFGVRMTAAAAASPIAKSTRAYNSRAALRSHGRCNPKIVRGSRLGMCTARRCHTWLSRMLPGAPFHVGRAALATTLEAAPAHCAARLVLCSAEVGHASFRTGRACDHVLV